MIRIVVYSVLAIVLLGFVLMTGLFSWIGYLLVGWVAFIFRVLPQISWNLEAIASGFVLIAGTLAMVHFLGKGFVRGWRWRWSFAGVAVPCWLFVLTIGIAGWSRSGSELNSVSEVLVPEIRDQERMLLFRAMEVWGILQGSESTMDTAWADLSQVGAPNMRAKFDSVRVYLVPGEDGKVSRVVCTIRVPPSQASKLKRIAVVEADQRRMCPIEDLPGLIGATPQPSL